MITLTDNAIIIVALCCILSAGYYIFSEIKTGKSRKADDMELEENRKKSAGTGKSKNTSVPEAHAPGYITTFLERDSKNDKSTVYISKEVIGKLKKIVSTIGGDKSTLGGYVEAIVINHFEMHKDEIIRIFNENIKQPFQ